jgi:hypothetical protein
VHERNLDTVAEGANERRRIGKVIDQRPQLLAVFSPVLAIAARLIDWRATGVMCSLDLPDEWRDGLIGWAKRTNAVRKLWLLGSRAKGTSRPDSDVDIAIALMPAKRGHDWALGDYFALATAQVLRRTPAVMEPRTQIDAVRRCLASNVGAEAWRPMPFTE